MACMQQDLPTKIDAAPCKENFIFSFFYGRLPILKEIKLYLEAPESKSKDLESNNLSPLEPLSWTTSPAILRPTEEPDL